MREEGNLIRKQKRQRMWNKKGKRKGVRERKIQKNRGSR